jgi:hypothetical protein
MLRETQLRAFLFTMLLLAMPGVARADVVGAGTSAEEVVECTWPSSSLLSGNEAGSSAGAIMSYFSGFMVYLSAAGHYVSCETVKWNETAIRYERPVFNFFNRMMAPKPRQVPPQQQQPVQQ